MEDGIHKNIWITNGDGIIDIHTQKPEYDDICKCWYSDSKHTIAGVYDEPEYSHDFTIDDLKKINALPRDGEMVECEIILRKR